MSALTTALIAGIPTLLGIAATIIAWKFNPRQKLYTEIDAIYLRQEALYVQRDQALFKNDSDTLTAVTAELNGLRERKKDLLQRLR